MVEFFMPNLEQTQSDAAICRAHGHDMCAGLPAKQFLRYLQNF
jgi:hypothetical protein